MTYFWNFGSTLGICLGIQILTGILITFHYVSVSEESFTSVVILMREIWSGWVLRFIHINGASIFFFFIYLHLFRGIYYISASHNNVWISGVTIIITLMAVSFLGYVLPWGQISYWAVAVITNLFSVIPLIGTELVYWIWGGFSVGAPTLTRFYSLHFVLPFILAFIVIIHLIFLHNEGSSNSMGLESNADNIQFHPYFTVKDTVFIMGAITLFISVSFFLPYLIGDAINNVPANPIQTPVHIQPEWYFLPSYAILRALPSNTAGVLALFLSVSIFYILPLFNIQYSANFSTYRVLIFWSILTLFLFLINIGSMTAEEPYIFLSKILSFLYFCTILTINI